MGHPPKKSSLVGLRPPSPSGEGSLLCPLQQGVLAPLQLDATLLQHSTSLMPRLNAKQCVSAGSAEGPREHAVHNFGRDTFHNLNIQPHVYIYIYVCVWLVLLIYKQWHEVGIVIALKIKKIYSRGLEFKEVGDNFFLSFHFFFYIFVPQFNMSLLSYKYKK